MKTSIIIMVLALSVFLKCKSQEEKAVAIVADCDALIAEHQTVFWDMLSSFQNNYLPDENEQDYKWDYDFKNSKISISKNGTPYLNIDFIHVGGINAAQKTWSWGKALNDKKKELYKVYEYGVENKCKKLTDFSWTASESDAWNMLAITNYILDGKGGARHYTALAYNYVVFTKIEKI